MTAKELAKPDRARRFLVSGDCPRAADLSAACRVEEHATSPSSAAAIPACRRPTTWHGNGVRSSLIDACRFGDGASGRNGGQFGTGQRAWPEELEEKLGYERSKSLFNIAEKAKRHLLDFANEHQIDIEFMPGQMYVAHKESYETLLSTRTRRSPPSATTIRICSSWMRKRRQERLGSKRYHCGVRDTGTGHIHPLKLLIGLARVAANAGAELFEMTKATAIQPRQRQVTIETPSGPITADRALIACNGYIGNLEPVTASHVMPIRSFIGATVPLSDIQTCFPAGRPWRTCASSCAISENRRTEGCSSAGARLTPPITRATSANISAARSPRSTRRSRISKLPMRGADLSA